jgi:hypothetical protein
MANYNEQMLAFIWLTQTLGGDSTLAGFAPGGVWRAVAPPDTPVPYVIMSHQAGGDVVTLDGYRVLTSMVIQVKAVGPAGITDTINSAAARIDRLLGGPPGRAAGQTTIMVNAVAEGYMYDTHREQPLVVDETVNGEDWTNIGGFYRCQVGQIAT